MANVEQCRSCGHSPLLPVIDLGETPVANRLVEPETPEPDPRYPLVVAFCEGCALVQLSWALEASEIFDANYPYFTSYAERLVSHAEEHARDLRARLGGAGYVVEIASNDGYFLQHFLGTGTRVLGVEPTPGPAAAARSLGVPTREVFFGLDTANELLAEGAPDVIVAKNVLAHVPDMNDFVAGLARLVRPGGIVSVENPWVREMIDNVAFDAIYHEHYSYLSCLSVDALFRRHALYLHAVTFFSDIHGGSLRWDFTTTDQPGPSVRDFLQSELNAGLGDLATYADFGARVAEVRMQLHELVTTLRSGGKTLAAYGAAAKGTTLLNTCGIGRDLVDFVADRNPAKIGKAMPGTRIPILAAESVIARNPDYLLLLAWNYGAEIEVQQQEYLAGGGRLVVPGPTPRVL